MKAACGIAVTSSIVGAGLVFYSMVAMAVTMGFGTRVFFPYFVIGIALLVLAIVIAERVKPRRSISVMIGTFRWLVVVPLLLSFVTLLVGWIPALLDGVTVHGAKEWFVILIVVLPALLFPELRYIASRGRVAERASDA